MIREYHGTGGGFFTGLTSHHRGGGGGGKLLWLQHDHTSPLQWRRGGQESPLSYFNNTI